MRDDPKRVGARRLLVGAYSAGNQRRFEEREGGYFVDSLLAQFRIDSLIAETIVVPDTYVFDGRFFAAIEPSDLLSRVGRGIVDKELPIEIRVRAEARAGERLSRALRLLLVRDGSDTLNGFPFNCISDAHARTRLAAALEMTSLRTLDRHFGACDDREVPGLLAAFLKQRADPSAHGEIERQKIGWERWIDAEQRGICKVVSGGGKFDISQALHDRPLVAGVLRTKIGRDAHAYIVEKLLHGSRHRSDVTKYLRQVREDYGLDRSEERQRERNDIEILDSWYSMGRHVAFGRQYQADVSSSFEPDRPMTGHLDLAMERISNRRQTPDFVAPENVFQGLASMSPEDFGRFTFESREKLRIVWQRGNLVDVSRLLHDLERRVRTQENPTRKIETLGAVGIVAGALGAPAVALAGGPGTVVASIVSAAFATVVASQAAPKAARIRKGRKEFKRAIQYLCEYRPTQ
jgi:hypothetical protein